MESSYKLGQDDIQDCYNRLKDFFPKFLEIAKEELKSYDISQNVMLYYSYALQYNLTGGKLLRGTLLISTVKSLCSGNMSEHLWFQTLILAWCVELLQTSFLVADDIMDQSTKRRSNTCWYLVPTIGIANAINDVMFLYTMINRIMFKMLKDSNKLVEIVETFSRASMTTILGQHMDTYESNNDKLFEDGTSALKLFGEIAKNKTSYYSFYLPIKLGMIMGNVEKSNLSYPKVEAVCVLIGSLFQAQDDVLDCYGNPESFGKEGTDIQTKKCSWLLAQALNSATEEQRKKLRENIGINDATKVEAVKRIYDQMRLEEKFIEYELELEDKINRYWKIKVVDKY
nr:farnesyl pyrophosphate synthetase [Theileria orientalis]